MLALTEGSKEIALGIADLQNKLTTLRREFQQETALAALSREANLLALRMVRDNDQSAIKELWLLRQSDEYTNAYTEAEPLVSIVICTYLNWKLLAERSLPSIVAQTYENWEVIVVGDAAPDEARKVVDSFADNRIRFVNQPYRGPYPEDPMAAWLVTGTTPSNTGVALAKGRWIGFNSDDDALRPRHIELLLANAIENNAEVSYGRFIQHEPDAPEKILGTFPPTQGTWGAQNSLVHAALSFIVRDPTDWVFGIANDVSVMERMLRIGVRFSMIDEVVFDYFPSRMWLNEVARLSRRPDDLFMQSYRAPDGYRPPLISTVPLSFGVASGVKGALVSGWSEPEDWGVWSTEEFATIRFAMDSEEDDITIGLRLRAAIWRSGQSLTITCRIGDDTDAAARWRFEDAADLEVFIPIPGGSESSIVDLHFEIADVRSPAEQGIGADSRRLGIGVIAAWLVPAGRPSSLTLRT